MNNPKEYYADLPKWPKNVAVKHDGSANDECYTIYCSGMSLLKHGNAEAIERRADELDIDMDDVFCGATLPDKAAYDAAEAVVDRLREVVAWLPNKYA